MPDRYFVREGRSEPREVDLQTWVRIERSCNFESKFPDKPATGGFYWETMGGDYQVKGAIANTEERVAEVLKLLTE